MKVHLQTLLILALDVPEWSASCSGCYTSKPFKPSTNQTEGWEGNEANPDILRNRKTLAVPGIEAQFLA